MNRDELLEAVFSKPVDDLPKPEQWFDWLEEVGNVKHVRSTVGLGYRRVVVRHSTPPGSDISASTTTLRVAALMNVCTDPDFCNQGFATLQMLAAHEAAASHELTDYATLFAGPDVRSFFEMFGYFHPAGSPADFLHGDFLVCELREDVKWPDGSVMVRDRW